MFEILKEITYLEIKIKIRQHKIMDILKFLTGGCLIAKSGIHIKEKNRGKFTALKKRTGKSST